MTTNNVSSPAVTVLMPVYNGEKYLREAIESILGQTFTDFEFLIINDGSSDASVDIIGSYRDQRIRLVNNDKNLGLIAALNRGLELAAGKYLARMDCDDISLPERLARQVAYMDSHQETAVCGTWFRKFGAGKDKLVRWHPTSPGIRCGLLFDSMIAHPTVMLRQQFLKKHGLYYDPACRNAEDYALWIDVAEYGDLANLDEVLLLYRVHSAQITQSAAEGQRYTASLLRLRQLQKMGIEPTMAELEVHQAISTCVCDGVDDLFRRAEEWLCKLKDTNDQAQIYPEPFFSQILLERWLTFCKKAFSQGQRSAGMVYFPELLKKLNLGGVDVIRYVFKQMGKV